MNTKIKTFILSLAINVSIFCADNPKLNPPLSDETFAAYAACKKLEKEFAARTIIENNGYTRLWIDPVTGERTYTPISHKVIQPLSKAEQAQLNDAHESLRKTTPDIIAINYWPFIPQSRFKFTSLCGNSSLLSLEEYNLARRLPIKSIFYIDAHVHISATSPAKVTWSVPIQAFSLYKKRTNPADVTLTTTNGNICYVPQHVFRHLRPIQSVPKIEDPLGDTAAKLRQLR
jgi:hypothetical protein